MPDNKWVEYIKGSLVSSCGEFRKDCCREIEKNLTGQHPDIAVLCCSDSRVIPELIFKKNVGDIFDVRVAGNVAMDRSVIFSLEYAVEHLGVKILLILGHSGCGAVAASEDVQNDENPILEEIRSSFSLHPDHSVSNVKRQLKMLPERSEVIRKAVEEDKIALIGGLYHIEDGSIDFI